MVTVNLFSHQRAAGGRYGGREEEKFVGGVGVCMTAIYSHADCGQTAEGLSESRRRSRGARAVRQLRTIHRPLPELT